MKRAAHALIASSPGTLRGCITVVVSCVALAAGCSTSTGARHGAAPGSTIVAATASTGTTVPTTTTTPPIIYRVKRGDTLTTIAHHFRVAISAVVSANHVANPDRLTEGQTLRIPPAPPLKLVLTPSQGHAGQAFQLKLTGAIPSETIRFEIDSAASKYTGGPHTASADGAVTATYQTALAAPTGIYTVTATGNLGSTVRAGLRIVAAAATATT